MSDGSGYLAVLGMDAAARVSAYAQLQVPEPGERLLDGSVVLDDVLGTETVLAVLCPTEADARRSIETARAALVRAGSPRKVATLDLPCLQARVSFRKEAPR